MPAPAHSPKRIEIRERMAEKVRRQAREQRRFAPSPPPPPSAEPANDIEADAVAEFLSADEGAPPLAEEEAPALERTRAGVTVGSDGRPHAKTIAGHRLSRAELRVAALAVYPDDVERPRTRAGCENMPRPCPYVSCAHHLYLDVNQQTGAIKLNFPHLEVWEMAQTCSLDVADRDGVTLEEAGAYLNVTRERIRQVEVGAVAKIQRVSGKALGIR